VSKLRPKQDIKNEKCFVCIFSKMLQTKNQPLLRKVLGAPLRAVSIFEIFVRCLTSQSLVANFLGPGGVLKTASSDAA